MANIRFRPENRLKFLANDFLTCAAAVNHAPGTGPKSINGIKLIKLIKRIELIELIELNATGI